MKKAVEDYCVLKKAVVFTRDYHGIPAKTRGFVIAHGFEHIGDMSTGERAVVIRLESGSIVTVPYKHVHGYLSVEK